MSSPQTRLNRFKRKIGESLYQQACVEAWQTAQGTGSRENWEQRKPIPELDAVTDELWSGACDGESDIACVEFLSALYREMPAYAVLSMVFLNRPYDDLDSEARRLFWNFAREMLSAKEDALADPVAYYMWCHFFESEHANEVWKTLTEGAPDRLLERILLVSGPVPFSAKRELYAQKSGNKRWHYFIYRSLLHSTFDVYGSVDRTEARRLLGRLKVSLSKDERKAFERLSLELQSNEK